MDIRKIYGTFQEFLLTKKVFTKQNTYKIKIKSDYKINSSREARKLE